MTFLSATWTLSGYDVAAHVAEETSHAAITVPRAMVWSTWSSAALGFIYLIGLALCASRAVAKVATKSPSDGDTSLETGVRSYLRAVVPLKDQR